MCEYTRGPLVVAHIHMGTLIVNPNLPTIWVAIRQLVSNHHDVSQKVQELEVVIFGINEIL